MISSLVHLFGHAHEGVRGVWDFQGWSLLSHGPPLRLTAAVHTRRYSWLILTQAPASQEGLEWLWVFVSGGQAAPASVRDFVSLSL